MSLTETSDRFTALPDEQTLAATVVALEEHGFSVEVVDDLDAARQTALARIPHGASVMTNTSMTLTQAGIDDAINDGGPYDSARNKLAKLDFATQLQEMKEIGGQPDFSPQGLATRSHSEYDESTDLLQMVREDLVAERVAIESYQEIVRWLGNDDPTSRRVIETILAVEEEHAEDLLSILQEMKS